MAIIKVDINAGSGFAQVLNYLKSTSENAKRVYTDMDRLAKSAKEAGNQFRGFSLGALGALTAIAAISPSLAGDLARLEVAGFRIAEAIGKAAKPAFDAFSGAVEGVATFLEQNPWASNLVAGLLGIGAALAVGGTVLNGLSAAIGFLGKIKDAAGLANGALLTLGATMAAVLISHSLGENNVSEEQKQKTKETFDKTLGKGFLSDAANYLSIAGQGLGNELSKTGLGDFIFNSTPLKGLAQYGNIALGSLYGFEPAAKPGEAFINTLPSGAMMNNLSGGALGNQANQLDSFVRSPQTVLIQIIDQLGSKRDYIVTNGSVLGSTR